MTAVRSSRSSLSRLMEALFRPAGACCEPGTLEAFAAAIADFDGARRSLQAPFECRKTRTGSLLDMNRSTAAPAPVFDMSHWKLLRVHECSMLRFAKKKIFVEIFAN